MSYKKQKSTNRYRKYTMSIGALMNFGELTAERISDSISMSYSSVAKVLRTLNEMEILNTYRSGGSIYYSLADKPCAVIIDVSDNKYVLNVCNSRGRSILSKTYRHDDRYFTDENLAFFLRGCARIFLSDNYHDLPLHLIADDDFIVKYKIVEDSYNPVAPVIAKYFDLKKTTVSNFESCIEHSVKYLVDCNESLLLTVCDERIMMSYVTYDNDFSLYPVRNIDTAELTLSADIVKTAASLAYALGNTVELLSVNRFIFDCCDVFRDPCFIPSFLSALSKFTKRPTDNIDITLMNYSLRLCGAIYTCHRRYLSLIREYED